MNGVEDSICIQDIQHNSTCHYTYADQEQPPFFIAGTNQEEIDAARLLVYRCAYLKDKGLPNTIETSMAKYYASEAASRAANKAVQIHGSYGFSGEYPVERYYRDIRAATILEGTSQMHQLIIGRNATGISAFGG